MKKLEKIHTAGHRIKVSTLAVLGVILLLPLFSFPAYAQPPGQECVAYAYTESDNHLFLLGDNKSGFGSNLKVVHDCPYIEIFMNGNFTVFTEEKTFEFPVSPGYYNVTLQSNNSTFTYNNFNLLPDRLTWQYEYYEWQNEFDYTIDEYITMTKATAQANWASILSIVVVFVLVTYVYWHLINSYIDRNFCEEVKS